MDRCRVRYLRSASTSSKFVVVEIILIGRRYNARCVELFPTFRTDLNAAIENILFDYRRSSLDYY